MKKNRQCKHCNKIFENIEGRTFSNHVRWCLKNPKIARGTKSHRIGSQKGNITKYGEVKEFEVICNKCEKKFIVKEREKKFPLKERYFCTRSCANSKTWSDETNKKRSISNTISSKKMWENPEFAKMMMTKNKRFTSKVEVLIREYFIKNYPDDEWTFGGTISYNDLRISRDLYSNKLKICIEYDGIWHFKDIHGQLQSKQEKDLALENWCLDNNYRLIRMSEAFYYNSNNPIEILEGIVYLDNREIIKIGDEYET